MAETTEKQSWFDRSLSFHFPALTVETLIFALIVLLAFLSRLYDLGARVMSHDESLHTYFSWLLYKGSGYQHNPMMHGPLQFHLLALTYFLFGSNDFTARLPHAISSILTIVMLWKWRRYLGRPGTLIAAGLILISPYMLFYGRYARNETFVGLFGILTLYAILRYLETGKHRYLYLLTAATVLHFTVKETAFIYTAQALLFLAIYFINRVTRNPWPSKKLFIAFVLALGIGIVLLGSTFGYVLYSRGHTPLSIAQTVSPALPGQTSLSTAAATSHFSPTALLVGAAAIAFLISGILLIYSYGWKAIRRERSFDMLMLLGTFVLPMLVAFPIKAVGWNPLDYNFTWSGLNLQALLQQGLVRTAIFLVPLFILSIILGLWWNRKLWLLNAALFYTIFILFYTTFFTNGQGFFTGLVGSLGYWLEQQGVNRGSQPWYYYLLIQIPIYEFLPALGIWLAVYLGIRRRNPAPIPSSEPSPALDIVSENPSEGNHTFILLFWWAISSALAFTIAGEKMPWLTFHITLPMILITGWALGQIVERTNWKHFRQNLGLLMTALIVIFLVGLGALLYNLFGPTPPFQGKELIQLSATTSFLFSLLALAGSLTGILYIYITRHWEIKQSLRLIVLTLFTLLAILTARTAFRASFIEYDNGTEYLVYAHGFRNIKDIMDQVEEISQLTAGDHNLVIAYDVSAPDTGVSWPFTWYLRDYTNTRPFDQPTKTLRDASVIIVDQKNFGKIGPVVGDAYYKFDFIRMVWPNQDYFSLTWPRIKNALFDPKIRWGIIQIWLNRDYTDYASATRNQNLTLTTWEPSDKMQFYIRKDVAAQIWKYGIAPKTQPVQIDPYEKGTINLTPDLTFGSTGQAEGQMNGPHGIAIAPDGSLYISDTNNHRIQHFSADGKFINTWGSFGDIASGNAPLNTFNQPWGVAVSPDGKWVYVADTWNHRIIKFNSNGTPIKAWGFSGFGSQDSLGFWGPRGIAVDARGRIFVADTGNKRISIFDSDGNPLGMYGSAGLQPGQFDEPVGLAFDAQENLYVVDTWNQRVQVFSVGADGITLTPKIQWDISGWYGQSLENKPYIAINSLGHIFVTDPDLSRVLEFTMSGEFVRTWGSVGTGVPIFGLASGIAVDKQGHVWVSDAGNNRILQFTIP